MANVGGSKLLFFKGGGDVTPRKYIVATPTVTNYYISSLFFCPVSGPTGGWSRNVQRSWKLSSVPVVCRQPALSAAPAALAVSLHTSLLVAWPRP